MRPSIHNLTNRPATPEMTKAGVVDLPEAIRWALVALFEFKTLPTWKEVEERAERIIDCMHYADFEFDDAVMVGGEPCLVKAIRKNLESRRVEVYESFGIWEEGKYIHLGWQPEQPEQPDSMDDLDSDIPF